LKYNSKQNRKNSIKIRGCFNKGFIGIEVRPSPFALERRNYEVFFLTV
jgi:hypothetical protein